jgi:hypothetical protein
MESCNNATQHRRQNKHNVGKKVSDVVERAMPEP